MLTFWGKLIKNDKIIRSDTFASGKEAIADALLECLEYFSKTFDIEAPMWHSNHTKQFGLFRKAVFKPDDFIDKVAFDRFEIQILDE